MIGPGWGWTVESAGGEEEGRRRPQEIQRMRELRECLRGRELGGKGSPDAHYQALSVEIDIHLIQMI